MARRFRIHPAIGSARMGNSSQHYIGPETPGVPGNWDAATKSFKSFRDAEGKILRQGARFRVFEYDEDASGALSNPREIGVGADIVDVEWRVHLANLKASFFVFDGQRGADDNYVTRSEKLSPTEIIKTEPDRTNLRNAGVPAAERSARLNIDPGEKMISISKPELVEVTNTNLQIPIKSLGTLLLDKDGRLIVLGGYGESNSTENPPRQIDEYANNDTWFDDASDGTVKARIRLASGEVIDADPAWVFVGPPDFAPGIGNVVSLFDTLWDTSVRNVPLRTGIPATPGLELMSAQKEAWTKNNQQSLSGFKPSFLRDVYPLLKRAYGARDVHVSGIGNQNYHRTLTNWPKLADLNDPQAVDLRKAIFDYLRNPDDPSVAWKKMPRGLGDDYTALDNETPTPQSFLSLTRIQYALLKEWSLGNFISDWPGAEPVPEESAKPTPDELDKAAMENSVGGPFFPGIEVSWLIRVADIYEEPFRLKVGKAPEGEAATAPLRVGALSLIPGFFSQQMALPWQADFYDCHRERHEDPAGNEYYFMWWTAQRPDDVFASGGTEPVRWVREFDKHKTTDEPDDLQNLERFNQMQQHWSNLKFVSVLKDGRFEEEP